MNHNWATWAAIILPYVEANAVIEEWDLQRRYYVQNTTARQQNLPFYFCPTRRKVPAGPSVASDSRGAVPSFPHTPGGLGDYAACVGSQYHDDHLAASTKGFRGTIIEVNRGQCLVIDPATGAPTSDTGTNIPNAQLVRWKPRVAFNDILDGTANTFMVGEKHLRTNFQEGRSAGGSVDSSIFNGDYEIGPAGRRAGHVYAANMTPVAGTDAPLAKGPSDNYKTAEVFGSWHPGVCQFVMADASVRPISVNISIETLTRLACREDGLAFTLP